MFEALLGLAAWATLSLGCVANPTPHPALDDTTASNNADVASGFADSASPAASDASQEGADASAPLPDAGPPPEPDAGQDLSDGTSNDSTAHDGGSDKGADSQQDSASDVEAETSDTASGPPPVYITSWSADEDDGDGTWNPGETIWIRVVMNADADYFNYPGVMLEDDQELVTYLEDFFVFFGIFAGEPQEAAWLVTADAGMAAGTTVNFTASVSTLSCEESGTECPDGPPITFSLTLGESLP